MRPPHESAPAPPINTANDRRAGLSALVARSPGVDRPRVRWPLAFGFGLVHGFGFAGMLDVLGMPAGQLVSSVLAFNVGIELGQLAIVAVAVPVIGWMTRHAWHHRVVQGTSAAVCVLAAVWIVERLS